VIGNRRVQADGSKSILILVVLEGLSNNVRTTAATILAIVLLVLRQNGGYNAPKLVLVERPLPVRTMAIAVMDPLEPDFALVMMDITEPLVNILMQLIVLVMGT